MEKDKKVTALYCRLSKDDGSNSESLSIRTQKSMLMEYATRNGFGNCQYYVDDGYSGTNSDRPAFQELLDDIREGKVATVITKDQSRLGRNHMQNCCFPNAERRSVSRYRRWNARRNPKARRSSMTLPHCSGMQTVCWDLRRSRRWIMPKVFTKKGSSPTPAQTAGF